MESLVGKQKGEEKRKEQSETLAFQLLRDERLDMHFFSAPLLHVTDFISMTRARPIFQQYNTAYLFIHILLKK